uniref:Uncharacterized protein AlNc14C72G4904 n=1 Tax=Albugo laibachii Nc14 TaxID=890382 RepID=F0WE43_9STRA|nr:conserved hypothetical protein [Albugo laibachii Nc14]|eukprot:CCA19472.1 conserved hypothetical protein [Albugo laibachii Nc14]
MRPRLHWITWRLLNRLPRQNLRDRLINAKPIATFVRDSTSSNQLQAHRGLKSLNLDTFDRLTLLHILYLSKRNGYFTDPSRTYVLSYPLTQYKWNHHDMVLILEGLLSLNQTNLSKEFLIHQLEKGHIESLYSTMALCMRKRNAELALAIFNFAAQNPERMDAGVFTGVIHCCACDELKHIRTAIRLFERMEREGFEPNYRTYGAILLAYARLNHWNEIHSLLEIVQMEKSTRELNKAISCAIVNSYHKSMYIAASKLFMMMLEGGMMPKDNHVWHAALSSSGRIANIKTLDAVTQSISSQNPVDKSLLCIIMSAYGYANKPEKAFDIFDRERDRIHEPNADIANALLTTCMRSESLDRVTQVIDYMKQNHIHWDLCTLNILLQICAIHGDFRQAEEYWRTAEETFHIRVDRQSYELLVQVYTQARAYDKVFKLWQDDRTCRRRGKSSLMLNCLIDACKEYKDIDTALKFLDEFQERGHVVSSFSQNRLISVFLACDQGSQALAYYHEIMLNEKNQTPHAVTALLKHYMSKNEYEKVMELYHFFISEPERLHFPLDAIYLYVAKAAALTGEHQVVLDVYKLAEQAGSSVVISARLGIELLESCKKANDWKSAVTLYDHLHPKLNQETAQHFYKQVLQVVASAGEYEEALNVNGGAWYRSRQTDVIEE